MRINDITEAVKSRRPANLFNMPWQIFTLDATTVLDYRHSAGELMAYVEHRGRIILWVPFDFWNRIGFFYIMTPDELQAIQKTPKTDVTIHDIHAAYLYMLWDRAAKEKRQGLAEEFAQLSPRISKQFKSAPPILYRGMVLDNNSIQQLQSGASINLLATTVSSWTTLPSVAEVFASRTKATGIIIEKQMPANQIVCNLYALNQEFRLPLNDRYSDEHEVLVAGNGIGPTLSANDPSLTIKLHKK